VDSNNTTIIERENSLDALLSLSRGEGEASGYLEGSGEQWHKQEPDSERLRRYEASRKQSDKRKKQRASSFDENGALAGHPTIASVNNCSHHEH
jgi:hypothetical protein